MGTRSRTHTTTHTTTSTTTSTPTTAPGARLSRALRVGIGGPVGSGKTALVAALCRSLSDEMSVAVVTNDIFTTEDAAILERTGVLASERILGVQTGCCPHTAIRDDISENLDALATLEAKFDPDVVFLESGGDNLTATFSRALVDVQIFVIDVAGGDKVPAQGWSGHHAVRPPADQQDRPRAARGLRPRASWRATPR